MMRHTIFLILLILFFHCAIAQSPAGHLLQGRVITASGTVVPGVALVLKKNGHQMVSDITGRFSLTMTIPDTLLVTHIGYQSQAIPVSPRQTTYLTIHLEEAITTLNEVVVNTGYQSLPKERATGSFALVDNQLLNRRISTDVVSKLEGVVPGLLFNRNTVNAANGLADLSIRGHSTLFANDQPLVVVDGFPYDGDLSNLNPNDIESVSVLKDAAAASIWGVRSGNGVIVLTTKKGRPGQKLAVELNANITVGNKPDLWYNPNFLNSNDFINVEDSLFVRGYYNADLTSSAKTPVSPVVQLLANQRAGLISASDATTQINALRSVDARYQLSHYFYRPSVYQQYALNLKGGNSNSDYFFSLGYDPTQSYFTGNNTSRVTLNSLYNFHLLKNLQLSVGFNYTQSNSQTNSPLYNNGGIFSIGGRSSMYPYMLLADSLHNGLPIAKDFALNYTNTAGNGKLLDWSYRPLDELKNSDNTTQSIDNRVNMGAQYDLLKHFTLGLKYQYEHTGIKQLNYYNLATYYTRNLINQYTQVSTAGALTYPIPLSGILKQADAWLTSQRARVQANYNNAWGLRHELTAIAGVEVSEAINESDANTVYGYDQNNETSYATIDYNTNYALNPRSSARIPTTLGFSKSTDHYVSYFGNAAYTYLGKYTLSASGRIDKSNLFGVNTNQKSVPLYSAGLSWNLSKENFYHWAWVPLLKLRVTYGYTGNINKSATAVTTFRQFSATNNSYSSIPFSQIANPGNPDLRWEKVRMINFGLDYALKNEMISGSVEYYLKKGIDLFGNSPLPPSTGLTTFMGNTANTKGKGLDFILTTRNLNGKKFKWNTTFLLSYVSDIVDKYNVTLASSSYIVSANASSIYPLTGKSIYGLYAYRWAGLSQTTGDPQGYLNQKPSTDYSSLLSNTTINDMVYNGSARPVTFGSLRNTFTYQNLSFSFNITYKFNYYFRRGSYASSGLPWTGHQDYYKRWQHPGDELTTHIPSWQLPPYNTNREQFYKYASVLVDKGDHIRLQDITLSYDLDQKKQGQLPFTHLQLSVYLNNIAILWRANHDHLDPDLSTNSTLAAYPLPYTIAFGIKAKF